MRRLEWKGVLTGAVVMLLLTGVVYAASGTVPAQLLYENIRIFLDGDELVPKDANGVTVEPFIIDGTTYVPIRAISEAYDKEVSWDEEKKEIHINRRRLPTGRRAACVDDGRYAGSGVFISRFARRTKGIPSVYARCRARWRRWDMLRGTDDAVPCFNYCKV